MNACLFVSLLPSLYSEGFRINQYTLVCWYPWNRKLLKMGSRVWFFFFSFKHSSSCVNWHDCALCAFALCFQSNSQCTSKRTTDSLQSLVCSHDFDQSIKILTWNVDLLQHYFATLRACFSSSLRHCRLVCFLITALSTNVLCAGARCLFLFLLLLCYVITPPTSGLPCITPALFVVSKERPFHYY